jgi:hypothetical protein
MNEQDDGKRVKVMHLKNEIMDESTAEQIMILNFKECCQSFVGEGE